MTTDSTHKGGDFREECPSCGFMFESATPAAAETAQPAAPEPDEIEALYAQVGKAMVEMTTTVWYPNEWMAIPGLWQQCMEERDRLRAVLATQAQPATLDPIEEAYLRGINEGLRTAAEAAEVEERMKSPPCVECGAMTEEEAGTKCRCAGDKDDCHGCRLWPDPAPATHAEVLTDALQKIAAWELPESGRTWDDGSPMSYEAAWGSNGARDYIRGVARAAIATQAAQQPKDLGDAATRPGLSAGAPIPIAACGGWVRMEDAAPPPDTDCVVWVRYSPGPGHFSIDRWEMQREDPIGMGGPTIETGHGWSDNFESDVVYWLALAPVPDAEYDPREGSLVAEGDGDEGSTPHGQEPGPKDAP